MIRDYKKEFDLRFGDGIPQLLVGLIGEESRPDIRICPHGKVRSLVDLGRSALTGIVEGCPENAEFAIGR